MWLQILILGPHVVLKIYFAWSDLVPAIVQPPWMLMANQNLLQKHARRFSYDINLNERGYIGLFFLTGKIYEKICLRKGLIFENKYSKNFFSDKKQKDDQHWGSLHTASVLK